MRNRHGIQKRRDIEHKRKHPISLCMLSLFTVLLLVISAREVMAQQTGSITIESVAKQETDIRLSGAVYRLYQVGTVNREEWELTQEFAPSGIVFDFENSDRQREQAGELADYAEQQGITGERIETDDNGSATVRREQGVYLLVQEGTLTIEDITYYCLPSLFALPVTVNAEEIMDITVEPKYTRFTPTPTGTPKISNTPTPTGNPEISNTPTPTGTPEISNTPLPTDTPKTTTVPKRTDSSGGKKSSRTTPITTPGKKVSSTDSLPNSVRRMINGTPKTGDVAQVGGWSVLFLISLGMILYLNRKRNRNHKNR